MSYHILNRLLGAAELIGYTTGLVVAKEANGGQLPMWTAIPLLPLSGFLVGDGLSRLGFGQGCIAAYKDEKSIEDIEQANAPAELNIDGVIIREMQSQEEPKIKQADSQPIIDTVIHLHELYHSDVKPWIEQEQYDVAYSGMDVLARTMRRRYSDIVDLDTEWNTCIVGEQLRDELLDPNGQVKILKDKFEMYLDQTAMRAEALRKRG